MDRAGTVCGNSGTQKEGHGLRLSQPPSQLRQFLCGSWCPESRSRFDPRRGFFHHRPFLYPCGRGCPTRSHRSDQRRSFDDSGTADQTGARICRFAGDYKFWSANTLMIIWYNACNIMASNIIIMVFIY